MTSFISSVAPHSKDTFKLLAGPPKPADTMFHDSCIHVYHVSYCSYLSHKRNAKTPEDSKEVSKEKWKKVKLEKINHEWSKLHTIISDGAKHEGRTHLAILKIASVGPVKPWLPMLSQALHSATVRPSEYLSQKWTNIPQIRVNMSHGPDFESIASRSHPNFRVLCVIAWHLWKKHNL